MASHQVALLLAVQVVALVTVLEGPLVPLVKALLEVLLDSPRIPQEMPMPTSWLPEVADQLKLATLQTAPGLAQQEQVVMGCPSSSAMSQRTSQQAVVVELHGMDQQWPNHLRVQGVSVEVETAVKHGLA